MFLAIRKILTKMITQNRLNEMLSYDESTGVLLWKKSHTNSVRAGQIAGAKNKQGYIAIGILMRRYLAHRIIWMLVYGEWPKYQIDHINGIRSDNRLSNLREATNEENLRNAKKRSDNTSGFKGVCWDKSRNRWIAHINIRKKLRYLGRFATAEKAYEAYCLAAEIHHKEFKRLS